MDNNEVIQTLRSKVDEIDNNLIKLLIDRKEISEEIIKTKLANNLPVFDAKRENEIINTYINKNISLNPTLIEKIFHILFDYSKREHYKNENLTTIDDNIKRKPLIIAGPCVVESENQINTIANEVAITGVKFLRGGTFKPRTSPASFQGLGNEGVKLLSNAAKKNNMYSVTEILEAQQYEQNREYIDIVQIGSRNMTSFGLLKSIGKMTANDKKYVLLKRGFAATINEFLLAADYLLQAGNERVILCLRGIRTFEQIDSNLRFTPDLGSILELKDKTTLPIIFDPSHSAGNSKYIVPLSNAALQLGADGLIIETHNTPKLSLSDAKQAITPNDLLKIINL